MCGEETEKMDVWWLIAIVFMTWLPLTIMIVSYFIIFISFNKCSLKTKRKGNISMNVKLYFSKYVI